MTDLDLVTGTIAARIRALPEVPRLYPPRRASTTGAASSAAGMLTALAADDSVTARLLDGVTAIEVDVAVTATAAAPAAARAVTEVVREVLDGVGVTERSITVRVASVEA